MPATNRDIINSAMGASQDPNFDDIQSAMGGSQPGTGGGGTPPLDPGATVTVDDYPVMQSGQNYTFTARRTGSTASPMSRTMQVAMSTAYPPGSSVADWPNGTYPTATANFPAGSATAPFTITAPVAAQPE